MGTEGFFMREAIAGTTVIRLRPKCKRGINVMDYAS
jgi:hypothetical protein